MIRAAGKAVLRAALHRSRLVREFVVETLVRERAIDYATFLRLARDFHVTAVHVRGEYGTFGSTCDDVAILGVYGVAGTWAGATNARVRDFFAGRACGTYVDVGANIGLTTVPIAQNAAIRCIAFEPEPTNYRNLCRNVETNCANANVTTHQVALFSERSSLEFELAATNLGDHRVRLRNMPGAIGEHERRTIVVQAVPLDEIIGPIEGPLAVKVDTQGAEPFVIAGGAKTLARADLVIMEFWPYGMHRMGGDPETVIRYFEQQFTTLSIAREERLIARDVPVAEAARALREYVERDLQTESAYYDVIGTR